MWRDIRKKKIMSCGFNDRKLDDVCDGKSVDGGFSCKPTISN